MEHVGVVTRSEGGTIRVRVRAAEACAGCRIRDACRQTGHHRELIARNEIGARQGQTVRIDLPGGRGVEAAFVLYGVPTFLLLAGALAGHAIGPAWSVLGSGLGLGFGLILARAVGGRRHRYVVRAVEVLPDAAAPDGASDHADVGQPLGSADRA